MKGFKLLFYEEHNARIHTIAAVIVIIAGIYFEVSMYEWILLIFSIGLVFTTELINTSIENLGDFVSTERSEALKKIKDLSAAAVLCSAITAILTGLFIFVPKLI